MVKKTVKDSKRWWAVALLSLVSLILGMDDSVLNLALPSIAEDFWATITQMQWAINAYLLSTAAQDTSYRGIVWKGATLAHCLLICADGSSDGLQKNLLWTHEEWFLSCSAWRYPRDCASLPLNPATEVAPGATCSSQHFRRRRYCSDLDSG